MPVKLQSRSVSPIAKEPFKWETSVSPEPSTLNSISPQTSWLPAREMKLFGAEPLSSIGDTGTGLVKCNDCNKPVLKSCAAEHAVICATVRAKKGKGKFGNDLDASRKRKASPSPDEPSKKKAKASPTKPGTGPSRRNKGPVDLDKQCGVINDKDLPCSRSLTCKSHSMGAKRAVQGRSRLYDDLLLDWQRAHNPNFVEPVKKETKAEKKAKKEAEKAEKKRLAAEAAAANAAAVEQSAGPITKKSGGGGGSSKKSKKAAAAAAAAVRIAEGMGADDLENLEDLDSEAEVDELVKSIRTAREKGVIAVPLATPNDASSWFVQRRERARCCRDLLENALNSTNSAAAPSAIPMTGLHANYRPFGSPAIGLGIPASLQAKPV